MPHEGKYIGSYHPIVPHVIPTEGMLKSPYKKEGDQDIWTDEDSHLADIVSEVEE